MPSQAAGTLKGNRFPKDPDLGRDSAAGAEGKCETVKPRFGSMLGWMRRTEEQEVFGVHGYVVVHRPTAHQRGPLDISKIDRSHRAEKSRWQRPRGRRVSDDGPGTQPLPAHVHIRLNGRRRCGRRRSGASSGSMSQENVIRDSEPRRSPTARWRRDLGR